MLKIALFLLLALLLFGFVRAQWRGRGRISAEERSVSIRLGAVAWLVGAALLTAFVFLPNKQRVLMLVPVAIFALGYAKFWQDKRLRLRREHEERRRVETMKRVHPVRE